MTNMPFCLHCETLQFRDGWLIMMNGSGRWILFVYNSSRFLAASGAYLGMSSSTFLMKSDFSAHPLQALSSPQSERIFFKSLTFSFFRFTFVKSICLSKNQVKISCETATSIFICYTLCNTIPKAFWFS